MDELLSLKKFEKLLPRTLEFVLTQVLSSKGVQNTKENPLEEVKGYTLDKDLVKHRILKEKDHKKMKKDITDLFSKKRMRKERKKDKDKVREMRLLKWKEQDDKRAEIIESRKNERKNEGKKKIEVVKTNDIEHINKSQQKQAKKIKIKGNILASAEFNTLIGKSGIVDWNEEQKDSTEEHKQTLSSMLAETPNIKEKDIYDLEYDKGKVKKVRTKVDQFKTMKNEFQRIENKGRKRYLEKEQKRRMVLKDRAKMNSNGIRKKSKK
mmetsp:Transcript_24250/g.21529  ORF Transcript_24250/g.21529 Transcript_24250/m.21529 type:complete len:266 (+) Transcript_24250:11-808(+)